LKPKLQRLLELQSTKKGRKLPEVVFQNVEAAAAFRDLLVLVTRQLRPREKGPHGGLYFKAQHWLQFAEVVLAEGFGVAPDERINPGEEVHNRLLGLLCSREQCAWLAPFLPSRK